MAYITRSIDLPIDKSFFLFGARNTGKSTLLRMAFKSNKSFWIDLLDPVIEEKYSVNPNILRQEVLALPVNITHIVIDEIQKIPKLLNVVHHLIESTNKIFVMTSSNLRKLKYGGANLLAGRAFVFNLWPLTSLELGDDFNLELALNWGSLPAIVDKMTSDKDKSSFLQAYAINYLKEEILLEQFIRKIDPFRKFLEVSAQCNGHILNIANIAKDIGIDDKTVKQYFSILEDTLMGFMLEAYHGSFRKRLHQKPKFYFFDIGVCRALARNLSVPVKKSTSYYGMVFEHFIINECIRLANYYFSEYRFSYIKTKDNVEIDLVVERPGKPLLCIEIKSATTLNTNKLTSFSRLVKDIPNAIGICIAQIDNPRKVGKTLVLPWQEALIKYFTPN